MTQRTIEVTGQSQLLIRNISGDLNLKGWKRGEIQLSGTGVEEQVQKGTEKITLESAGDLKISIPHQLAVQVASISGDASIVNLASSLEIEQIAGDLSLRDIGKTTIAKLGGDLFASRIRGDLTIANLGGDCLAKDVDGQFAGKGIAGDLMLNGVAGGIEAHASGDIHADFSPVPWQAYALHARGTIMAHVPPHTNAAFLLKSEGKSIQLNTGPEPQHVHQETYELELGEGGPQVSLSAGQEIILNTESRSWTPEFRFDADLSGLTEQITKQTTAQIHSHLANLETQLNEQLSNLPQTLEEAGLSEEKISQVRTRIEEASLKAAEKARKAAQKAEVKLEQKLAQAQRKARRETRSFDLDDFLAQKEQKQRSATEKERLMILNMLQEKKITAEQADELLAALEGEK